MRKTKFALMQSMIALLLCFSMLIGTTFAWFTDEVISGSNIIQAGNLDAEMYWTDDLSTGTWYNAEKAGENTPFDYDLWEPGYTEVRYVKIVNAGKLALKYNLTLAPAGEVGKLAEVIDVYYAENVTANIADRTLSGMTKLGALLKAMNGAETAKGELLPGGETIVAVALHMDELAGNEYQGKSIGDGFVFKLLATQLAKEPDSFGPDYDENATFPVLKPGSITADISSKVQGSVLTEAVAMVSEDGAIAATVPAGTKVSGNSLILYVSELSATGSNITLQENEILRPMDVHIEGVAEDNDAPILVTVKEAMMKGLNIGNYQLYHVEQSGVNAMTLGALDQHNGFTYDPATGDVTVALATFSEVTLVADTEKAWEGKFDYTWYDASKTELTIANADQLAAFGAIVGGMDGQTQNSFAGKTVKLISDINLGDDEEHNNNKVIFYPIGYWNNEGTYERKPLEERTAVESGFYAFQGTFDGNGNTISNFYQNTWEMKGDHNWYDPITEQYYRDGMGLFGKVYGGTVKNLTVANFSSDGEIATTGVIAAYADSANGKPATFENITIFNCNPRVYNIGNGGIVGCAGWYSRSESLGNADYTNAVTFKNITVDQTNKISALWGTYDVSCGGILGQYYPDSGCGIKLENCHVSAIIDVNNDVCANYQYYWYRYSGMFIGTIRANIKDASGYTVADPTGIIATGCTYSYGSWNEYWYCELVKNSSASYTHDYQFGRLTNIDDLSEIKSGETWLKEGNFALVSDDRKSVECYHIFKNSEGNLYRHFHNIVDESNPNIYEDFDLNGDGQLNDLKEDRQRYYLPFGQVFNGLGYGVKPTYTFEGFKLVEDGTVISGSKFNVEVGADLTYRPGEKIFLKDLVALGVDISKLSQSSLYVAASPVGDDSVANITYSRDVKNWENNYFIISNDTTGAIKLVITDYFYCTPTVIYLNPEQAAEKFTANTVGTQNAYTQITLGTLFGVKAGATIGNVTATVTDPNGDETTVTGTGSDWTTKTIDLTKDGTWTVAIKDDDAYCAVTTVKFTVNKVDMFKTLFTNDYLYRVGNASGSTVAWSTIFEQINKDVELNNLAVTVANVKGDAAGNYTNGAIQFSGTGVVTVTISADGANDEVLYLEVVDAVNATSATSATSNNVVLLNSTSSTGFNVSGNHTFYGNGFTITLDINSHASSWSSGYVGYVNLSDGNLDNVKIVGPVYPQANIYREQAGTEANGCTYFKNSVIVNSGDCKITNSYISGGRAAIYVKLGDDILIENTTVFGGVYANIEVQDADSITLRDVTTVQEEVKDSYNADGSKNTLIGIGVAINNDAADAPATEVYIEGTLNQYNWITETQWDTMLGIYASSFPDFFGNSTYAKYWHYREGDTKTKHINLSLIVADKWDANKIHDNRSDKTVNYESESITINSNSGGVYSVTDAGTLTDALYKAPMYQPTAQFEIAPTPSFDYTNKNYEATSDESNNSCYYDGTAGVVKITFEEGSNKVWDAAILTAIKQNDTLNYSVKVGNTTVAENINIDSVANYTFDAAGEYVVTYTYTDPYNYKLDESGNIVTYNKTYEETVTINVTVVEAAVQLATFKFGPSTGLKTAEKILVGNVYYLSATGVDSSDLTNTASATFGTGETTATTQSIKYNNGKTWASTTIDGNTYYFPVVAMGTTDKKWEHTGSWYGCFPVFDGVISISDPNRTIDTDVLPETMAAIYPQITFRHQGTTSKVPTTPSKMTKGDHNGKLCYTTQTDLTASNERDEEWILAKYTYTDAKNTYYWFVAYYCAASSNGGCVTPDTLVTLADGTKKEIQHVTYEDQLLVWDFVKGEYTVMPAAIIFNHGSGEYNVVTLNFSDGTTIKTINGHDFFDADLNQFVTIDENNVSEFVGHAFVKDDGRLVKVALESYTVQKEYTTAYSVLTAIHYNCFLEDMLTLSPNPIGGNFFMPFEVGEGMKFDAEKMQADIEKYGLFTYEEFADYATAEQFYALNGPQIKVAVGKGIITMEQLYQIIRAFLPEN